MREFGQSVGNENMSGEFDWGLSDRMKSTLKQFRRSKSAS